MKLIVSFLVYLLVSIATPGFAASGKVHLDSVDIDLSDKASLQRGAKIFMNYCLSCHSAAYMRYNRMGKDLGLSDAQVAESLMFASDKVGDTMTIAMRPKDAKKWFGVVPPDLSVISRARGTEWLYTYLRSYYLDINKPLGTNNLVFKDVGMPHVMWQEQGYVRKDSDNKLHALTGDQATAFEYNMMVRDLVNFLAYIGEPSKIQRLALGKWVLLYLALFFFVAYPLKKIFWEDVH
ncbi:MAG: cytochrome c1 [Piscirickettsiaceae bacterium]|jgi:ubiquinol-cytochrome c reductase cytochrome c1 subunit|nr:cytochrome c1 [Piscirickettsiaceae bacterium]